MPGDEPPPDKPPVKPLAKPIKPVKPNPGKRK